MCRKPLALALGSVKTEEELKQYRGGIDYGK